MADLLPTIETMEHSLMRAWIAGDIRTLKSATSKKFRMVIGSKPCVILDAQSWLQAAATRYLCTSYRFGDIYVHDLGAIVVFATQVEVEATMDGTEWSGQFWLTDIWRKSGVRRRWRIVERIFSRVEESQQVPGLIRSMQLWR